MKRLLLGAFLTLFSVPIFSSADFSDILGTPSSEAVLYLKDQNVISGFSDGTFRPENLITRAEFLKIALLAAGKSAENCDPTKSFPDVKEGEWYFDIVCLAVNEQVISGYGDGLMRPNDSISFAEAAKIVANINAIALVESENGEWFQPYVGAIERDRIFPGTISDIHQKLTRGEMAQMAWGAKTGNEVQNLTLGDLPQINSCEELSAQFQKAQKRQGFFEKRKDVIMFGAVDQAEKAVVMEDSVTENASGITARAPSASDAAGADEYSTTNIQEFGVDEADIVKNDGSHIFLIKGNAVRIVRASPVENLKEDSKIVIDNKDFFPQEMYLDADTLTIIGNSSSATPYQTRSIGIDSMSYYGGGSETLVVSYDVSDRKNPKKIRSVSFEGNYLSSRKIDDTVFVATNRWNSFYDTPNLRESEIMPTFSDSGNSEEKIVAPCSGIRYFPNFSDNNFLTVAAIDTKDPTVTVDREVILGGGENLYASSENIFITRTKWGEIFFENGADSGWSNQEKTEIYKFALGKNSIEFSAKGEVLGHPLNQFSMSEFSGVFRIATQIGEAWSSAQQSSTNVFTLDKDLKKLGEVRDIAPGENMKSARFEGNRGFLVTFKTVDPLFVLDLSDAKNPKVLGKLKIPGWSDYLHPWGDNYLLGFGQEVDESIDADKVHSDNAVYYTAVLGMKVSLFDISDLENPKEIQKMIIGDRGTTSALLNDHKALLADREKGIVGFPVTITKNMNGKVGDEADIQTVFSGALILDINAESGITERGRATNYKDNSWFLKSGEYFYGDVDRNINRILYIGDTFYTVAQNYIEALSWDDLSVKKTLQLDEKTCPEIVNEKECSENSSCKAVYYNSSNCVKIFGQDIMCNDEPIFSYCEEING